MKGLEGKQIGVAAARQSEAISALIQKNGGIPMTFPIQGERKLNESICEQDVNELLTKPFDIILLTTGIGAETLEKAADKLHQSSVFMQKMKGTTLAIRGSKTLKWVKKHELSPTFVSEDGTMEDLLNALTEKKLDMGTRLFLQAYNQDDALLKNKLEEKYDVYLSKPYHYEAPEQHILYDLMNNIKNQTLDAVVFTSKTQVQNLFANYSESEEMVKAFNEGVLAVAVGKVTAMELKNNGITHVLAPQKQKMGAMVVELSAYMDESNKG